MTAKLPHNPNVHTASEVAGLLGMSKTSVHRCIRRGGIKAYRLPTPTGAGKWRIPHEEFLRLVVLSQPAPPARGEGEGV